MKFQVTLFYLLPFYFFTPSFAGIIPSRFIGLFLSIGPVPAFRSPGLFRFSTHLIAGPGILDKNFFAEKPGGGSGLVELFKERFDSFGNIPGGYNG